MTESEKLTDEERTILGDLTGPIPAKALRIIERHEAVAKLYDQECGMCGSTADELVEFVQWKEGPGPTLIESSRSQLEDAIARVKELEQSVEFNYQGRLTSRRREAELERQVESLGKERYELVAAIDTLTEWANPISRDLGGLGGLKTIRCTMEDERAQVARLEAEQVLVDAWFDSWEAEPDEDLPEERALYRAVQARKDTDG